MQGVRHALTRPLPRSRGEAFIRRSVYEASLACRSSTFQQVPAYRSALDGRLFQRVDIGLRRARRLPALQQELDDRVRCRATGRQGRS